MKSLPSVIVMVIVLTHLSILTCLVKGAMPDPVILSVDFDKTSMNCGEWVTLTVEAKNYGDAAHQMYISISLPENPPIENIQMIYHNLDEGYILPVGAEVWGDYGRTYPIILEYPLVEGYCMPWEKDETKTLEFRVKPEKTGVFRFFVKNTAEKDEQWEYDPSSGVKDQQNEYVYVYEIDVQPPHLNLIQEYFPYLIFDEEEEYYPTDFYHDDTVIGNNPSKYDETWPLTVYIHTVEFQSVADDKNYLCIEYWFYYARDDGTTLIEIDGNKVVLGQHDHDWESIFIFLEKTDSKYTPAYVAYFHHMNFKFPPLEVSGDCWSLNKWGSLSFDMSDGTHPIVHVCRDSHASDEKTYFGYGLCWVSVRKEMIYDLKIPVFEPCDGGKTLGVDDFKIVYTSDPDPSWPLESFGEIQAPWARERWNDANGILMPHAVIKNSFSILSLHEIGSKLYLHTYDNQSRHVGFNKETSEIETEIPGSYYEDLGNTTFLILPENITDFTITVDATHADELVEEYEIMLTAVRENEIADEETMSGTIDKGEQQEFDAKLDENGEIIQIQEFPSFFILPLFMIITILAVVVYRKRTL